MREAKAALALVALLLAGCGAPTEAPAATVEPAAIPLTSASPVPPPEPPSADPERPSACVFDPCSRIAAEGFHVEPAVAMSPADPLRAVVVDFGSDNTGRQWAYLSLTRDGGATWTSQRAPDVPALLPSVLAEGAPTGILTIVADPVVAWPAPDTVVALALVGETLYTPDWDYARAIHVAQWRSTDGGETWSEGTIVARAEGATGELADRRIDARWYDKPALAFDAATGAIHVVFHRIASLPGAGFQLEALLITSEDAGASWSEPRAIPEMDGLYGASLAAYNGTILATLVNPGYRVLRSADAGATWSEVASFGEERPGSGTWQSAPVALWDAGGAIHAALARSEGEENERLLLHLSQDGGETWSNGTLLLPEAPTERRNPVLAVDPATGLGFVASHHGDGATDRLATWAIPLAKGIPRAPVRLDANASGTRIFEYFGGAAAGGAGIVAYPSQQAEGTPMMAAALRLD